MTVQMQTGVSDRGRAIPEFILEADGHEPVVVENPDGRAGIVLLCDHASNFIPPGYGGLGLDEAARLSHIAWDPGALEVARAMSALLDAPLVYPNQSRLIVDCNRPETSQGLMLASSEGTEVPGNRDLSAAERARRIEAYYRPFHDSVEEVLKRLGATVQALVSVHSFTPVYAGVPRPWHVGIVCGEDRRLSAPLLAGLRAVAGLVVGENEPYSPADEVYHSVERHGEARGLACTMIELRNDMAATPDGQHEWGARLAGLIGAIMAAGPAKRSAG